MSSFCMSCSVTSIYSNVETNMIVRTLYLNSFLILQEHLYCQLGPRYEGQLTRMAEPIPPSGQSSSYSLTTLSSSSSTDRRAETDRKVITTRIAVAHHFICRLRRRESCILGATSSQPTLPLHELPPARLVIHRQTSKHERRKGTLIVQSRSGILADFCPPATLTGDNGRAPQYRRAPRGGCCSGGRSLHSCTPSFGLITTPP